MAKILPQIEHVVVLMLENRSFDNLLGWLYDSSNPPKRIIAPAGSPKIFQGLDGANFTNPTAFQGGTPVPVQRGTDNMSIPTPDPNEKFKHMNQQIFGANVSGKYWLPPEGAPATMNGFVVDYGEAKDSSPTIAKQIMQTYTPDQVNAMSTLAYDYAVSDAWHASNPTQTLPNRAFMAAGTSEGRVNNLPLPVYGAKTIFNVLEDKGIDWRVYSPSKILPSLTRIAMVQLWDPLLDGHFHSIDQFEDDAKNGRLQPYTFLEPTFIEDTLDQARVTSEHPPTDVCAGDHYLAKIWDIVRHSPNWGQMLFIVTFDEHGGCSDHIPTPWGAAAPDSDSDPGDEGFGFNRFGVRIPTLMASPFLDDGTVFRSPDPNLPFDHTSILATVLDWLGLERGELDSQRVAQAPTFECIFNQAARIGTKPIQATCQLSGQANPDAELTDLEQGVLGAFALYRRHRGDSLSAIRTYLAPYIQRRESPPEITALLSKVRTRRQAAQYLQTLA